MMSHLARIFPKATESLALSESQSDLASQVTHLQSQVESLTEKLDALGTRMQSLDVTLRRLTSTTPSTQASTRPIEWSELVKRVRVSPDTGQLVWSKGHAAGRVVGSGHYNERGEQTAALNGERYAVATLVYLYHKRVFDPCLVYVDGDKTNVCVDNLCQGSPT